MLIKIALLFIFSSMAAWWGEQDIVSAIYCAAGGIVLAIQYKKP